MRQNKAPANHDASAHASLTAQDRIVILEDLLAFHSERNAQGVDAIFKVVEWLEFVDRPELSADELRARIAFARTGLTQLARELATGNLHTDEARVAILRSSRSAHPERLS